MFFKAIAHLGYDFIYIILGVMCHQLALVPS